LVWDNDDPADHGSHRIPGMTARHARIGVFAIVAFALGLFLARALLPGRDPPPATELLTILPQPRALPALTLVRHDGRTLDRGFFTGHWTLVFFGFTRCPDVCPTTLSMLAQAKRALADLPVDRQPQVLFVSVDPERDDAKQLAAYVTFFDPAFVGATGSAAQVAAAAGAFSVPYAKVSTPDGGYTLDHGSGLFLVGPAATLDAFASGAKDPAALARDFRRAVDYVEHHR
jgi:protein SCO1/2